MGGRVVAVGTEKGAWTLTQNGHDWSVGAPEFAGWKVTTFGHAPDGAWLAATASNWYGPQVHRRGTDGAWTPVVDGPAYPEGGPTLNQVWTLTTDGDTVWAGVDEAGLFRSDDNAASFRPVPGLNEHRTRDQWQPGLGGLCAHRVLTAGDRVWVAMSAVGTFRSEDGGETFEPFNDGIAMVNAPEDGERPEVGYCVHGIVGDPADPDRIWRQDHSGVYRTTDGADSWQRIETGLPGNFGFPIVRDHASGRLFVVPMVADAQRMPVDGELRAYRSDDDGDTWAVSGTGWPDEPAYTTVLRGAMDADQRGGVFFGTTAGDVWATLDAGDTWQRLPGTFPRILSVRVLESD